MRKVTILIFTMKKTCLSLVPKKKLLFSQQRTFTLLQINQNTSHVT